MKRNRVMRLLSMLLVLMLCTAAYSYPTRAAETEVVTATIPVTIHVGHEEGMPEDQIPQEDYKVQLTAVDGAPMPAEDTLVISGEGSAEFKIDFDRVGIYQYMVAQNLSDLDGYDGRAHYDETVYYIKVTVTNLPEKQYGIVVAAHKNSFEDEKSEIDFENTYDPEPTTEEPTTETPEEPTTETPTEEPTTPEPTNPSSTTTPDPTKETSPDKVLGIEDNSRIFGIMMLAIGTLLMLAVVGYFLNTKNNREA